MEFKGIQKREEGKFITRYDITYETVDKKEHKPKFGFRNIYIYRKRNNYF